MFCRPNTQTLPVRRITRNANTTTWINKRREILWVTKFKMCFKHARLTHVCDFAAGHWFGCFRTFSNTTAVHGDRNSSDVNNLSVFANYGFITCLLRGRVSVCNKLQAAKTNDTPAKLHTVHTLLMCDCCPRRAPFIGNKYRCRQWDVQVMLSRCNRMVNPPKE